MAGIERLKSLFSTLDARPMSLAEAGEAILNYYTPILQRTYEDHPRRLRDLEQLLLIMERYSDPEAFLSDMALEPPNTSADHTMAADRIDEDRLVLSTVHSAKGLEWNTVLIIWALDGRFPSVHSLQDEEAIEEELRLMYVAATRAKERLFFTCPMQSYDRSSGILLSRPSRFIEDIPESVLVRWRAELY
jgi:DNA helicase-2/ATP-dependent DNA helicase PcrA